MGVVSAILKFAKVDWYMYSWNATYGEVMSIVPFILLIAYLAYASMKVDKAKK